MWRWMWLVFSIMEPRVVIPIARIFMGYACVLMPDVFNVPICVFI